MILVPCLLFSQRKAVENVDYNRSSLHVMMIEDNSMPKQNIIIKTFNEMPFPDKYDNHLLRDRSYNILGIKIDAPEDKKNILISGRLKDIDQKIDAYFANNRIGNEMIAKWVNRQDDGTMNQYEIQRRGLNDAKADEIETAAMLESGYASLEKAGMDLISNTFLVLNYFSFMDNEKVAKPIAEAAYATAKIAIESGDMPAMGKKLALKAAEAVLNKALEKAKGYTVSTTAYLYQLDWNDSISQVFGSKYWINEKTAPEVREERNKLFKETNFKMKFIGREKALVIITQFKTERSESDQIKEATIRSVDKVYVKLQKNYDIFKTKTQFFEVDKKGKICTAKIGMKEGLEGGEKFDVLEPGFSSSGKQKWKKKGTIKVNKKAIWDNSYYMTNPPELDAEDAIVATSFKGCKKGWGTLPLLIRQQK